LAQGYFPMPVPHRFKGYPQYINNCQRSGISPPAPRQVGLRRAGVMPASYPGRILKGPPRFVLCMIARKNCTRAFLEGCIFLRYNSIYGER
jgi:hypothetical protein